jgi:hypothetical protein
VIRLWYPSSTWELYLEDVTTWLEPGIHNDEWHHPERPGRSGSFRESDVLDTCLSSFRTTSTTQGRDTREGVNMEEDVGIRCTWGGRERRIKVVLEVGGLRQVTSCLCTEHMFVCDGWKEERSREGCERLGLSEGLLREDVRGWVWEI